MPDPLIQPPSGPAPIQLVITLDPRTNAINVSGPIDNKVLSYGLLAIAHDIIHEHNTKIEDGRRIVPVSLLSGN